MGYRRTSRELALQGLYMYEVSNPIMEDLLSFRWDMADRDDEHDEDNPAPKFIHLDDIDDQEEKEEIASFASTLVKGTIENIDEIDAMITSHSTNWDFKRIDTIDKSILRFSVYSLLYQDDIPRAVTIDEAIELGKQYGGENSGQFINGILDSINHSHPAEKE